MYLAQSRLKQCRKTHWSTDLSTPVMERSFLSSTVTLWSVSVLKTEKISYDTDRSHLLTYNPDALKIEIATD